MPVSLGSKYLCRECQTHSKTMTQKQLNIYIPIKISTTYQKNFNKTFFKGKKEVKTNAKL